MRYLFAANEIIYLIQYLLFGSTESMKFSDIEKIKILFEQNKTTI